MSDLLQRLRTIASYLPEQASMFREAADEIERLRRALAGIAEYCSGEDQTLGAIKRLVAVRNTAERALRQHQQLKQEG